MTLQQLRYFKEVAYVRHFIHAAENLYVSQPSLSRSIQELERELGVPLFVRNCGKSVVMTEYGQALLPYVEQIFENLDEGKKQIDMMKSPMSGTVTIYYSYLAGFSIIPQIFNQLHNQKRLNNISLDFIVNHSRDVVSRESVEKMLLTAKADIGITYTPFNKGLESVCLARQDLVLMLPKGHALAGEKRLSLSQVQEEPLICDSRGTNLHHRVAEIYESSGLKAPSAAFEPDWSSRLTHVALGNYITISPRLPVDPEKIAMVELDHPFNYQDIYLSWPVNRMLQPSVKYIKDFCIECFMDRAS